MATTTRTALAGAAVAAMFALTAPPAAAGEARDPVQVGAAWRVLLAETARKATGGAEQVQCKSPTERGGCLDAPVDEVAWEGTGAPPAGVARDVPRHGITATVARETAGSPLSPGDECLLGMGDTVVTVGSDPALGTLARISVPARHVAPVPDACADGTLAFVSTRDLASWPGRGEVAERRKAMASRVAAVAEAILPSGER